MTTDVDQCTEWRALASCRVDGELDELQTARLERHLLGCAACRAWTRDVAAVAALVHDAELVLPADSLELPARALRRRGWAAAVGTTVASAAAAAAAAAFALGLPSSGLSPFSSGSRQISMAPCTSCTKKQALTFAPSVPAVAPIHVANPLVKQE